jgi:3-hydroxyisobutyrate dehydrogenase-like beta-hydroxyacid dehydrogenase
MQIKNVSFIGLGVMGYPMAGYLQKNDFNVTVFNRTITKSEKWIQEYGGSFARTPGEASKNSDAIFICVGRDEDLREVMEGSDGILQCSKENAIIIDHTTASADIAREFHNKCLKNNKFFLDAPISGG